jgi:acetolactate synthase-1/2/3 large subunit
VKWATSARKVRDLVPTLEQAFKISKSAVPGPVFVECPVDLLYDEAVVREWYGVKSSGGRSLSERALKWYLNDHVNRLFAGADDIKISPQINIAPPSPSSADVRKAAEKLQRAERPLLLVGSQALFEASEAAQIAAAVERLGMPVYLSGMARGLLGKQHPLLMRHKRREALKEADLVMLAGVPCDFRLDYGRHIRRSSYLISANRSRTDLKKNRRPHLGVFGDPGRFLRQLADELPKEERWTSWREQLRQRDQAREQEIQRHAAEQTELLNPVRLCREIEKTIPQNTVVVADGGDFVATASYIVNPSGPLTWLDPGVFGTLGVGAGFALGAKLCRPEAEIWILFGDGSVGYSLSEFDTFLRHQIPVLAIVGNDACWTQIAREQVEMLKDDVGTVLRFTDYDAVAEGFGSKGFLLKKSQHICEILQQARKAASQGQPVLVNAHLGKTAFRKGSVSM